MKIPKLSTLIAFFVIAFGGYEAAVPAFGLGVRVQLVYGVFLSNAILMAYIALFVGNGGLSRLRAALSENRATNYMLLIVALGLLGIVSAAVNQTSMLDMGQAGRLLLMSAHFVLVIYWSRTRGRTFALRAYLAGLVAGGLVNLYYTFAVPQQIVLDVVPVLYSSNGSGGSLGIGMVLAAWLWILKESRADRRVAAATALVGLVAVAMSYSKTAMLIGIIGLGTWAVILTRGVIRRGLLPDILRISAAVLVLLLATGLAGARVIELAVTAITVKFGNMTFERNFGIDDYNITGSRFAYWPMTGKILVEHPIAGVGYGGIYDAYEGARADYDHIALRELEQARTTNPHNSFLYFVGANGTPGLVVVVLLFAKSLHLFYRCCARYGLQGRLIWVGLSLAYLAYGFTLPTLFNTEVLYLPAAVALVARQQSHRAGEHGAAHG